MINKLVVLSTIAVSSIVPTGTTSTNINNIPYIIEDSSEFLNEFIQSNEFEKKIKLIIGQTNCINTSTTTYNYCGSDDVMDSDLKENMRLLVEFSKLTDNWDEYGALAPSKELIYMMMDILPKLSKQPDIFPTPEGNIQLEYTIGNNKHLNIEFFPNSTISIFEMFENRTAEKNFYSYDLTFLNERINKFYERISG